MTLSLGRSEFEVLTQASIIIDGESPSTDVHLFALHDKLTLEYEDRVLLRFTPAEANTAPGLESNFEYIRDTAIVNIIDDDRKFLSHKYKCIDLWSLVQFCRSILESVNITLRRVQIC